MSMWFKKQLGDAVMAAPVLETLKEKYIAMYAAPHSNDSPQVWVQYDAAGGLHCEVTVYFSPAAAALAMSVGAEVTTAPSLESVSPLMGQSV